MENDVDVAVVGAGPVGLLLAVELALGGARVAVLERLAAPNPGIKALGVGPLGAEALQRRGLGDALAAEEARNLALMDPAWRGGGGDEGRSGKPRFSGHFGFLFLREDARGEPGRRMRAVPQQALEAMLGERARALGVEVRRECALEGFAERAGGVDLDYAAPDGPRRLRCSYLVGCDGGRSAVRKLGGFAFPGTPPTMTLYQAVAEVEDPAGALPRGWHRTPNGVFGRGPFPRRLFMLDFSGPPADRDAPVTREEVETVLRRVSGADVRLGAMEQANRWADNTRLADTYRRGRVFLAGDAAHVHSPFGGQGLSLGLCDAADLGWRMAAVLRGGPGGGLPAAAAEALLDGYTAERRPVAEAVLANTLAQAALLRPDPQSGALRDVLAGLLDVEEVNRRLGATMRGLSNRYDLGSDRDEVGRLIGDRPAGPGGATLYGLMQGGAGALLDASPGGEASALAAGVPGLRGVRVEAGPSLLVRPDGCVAWAAEPGDTAGLGEALARWFAPAAAGAGAAVVRSEAA